MPPSPHHLLLNYHVTRERVCYGSIQALGVARVAQLTLLKAGATPGRALVAGAPYPQIRTATEGQGDHQSYSELLTHPREKPPLNRKEARDPKPARQD